MRISFFFLLWILGSCSYAAVLPEDRADVLYHNYDGGGVEISGPSILVRKKFGDFVSASVNHYVDNVSSASVDVLTSASRYSEKRDENSLAVDILHNSSTIAVSLINSQESDFDASTFSLGFTQDMFGDLTTVSMGFSRGDNTVGRNGDADFDEQSDSRSYRLGVSQIFTKDLIVSFSLESVTDEGFLSNPYRSVRYLDTSTPDPGDFVFQSEVYPRTRTSTAFAMRGRYFLERRSALNGGIRFYSDSWGIESTTLEAGYTWPHEERWIIEASLRFYEQQKADFYNDLFAFENAQNFLARDKELSTFQSITLGGGFSYELDNTGWSWIKRGSLNFYFDHIMFDYDDFRDLTVTASAGSEPLYSFNANVIRAFASFWF
ncbi:MAG: DUF3570 domain-containing protein [Gammaproteobacteria bacterium]|nr:DUF3570 domain-containing protein [Gammaproteobacteria bacterium]